MLFTCNKVESIFFWRKNGKKSIFIISHVLCRIFLHGTNQSQKWGFSRFCRG